MPRGSKPGERRGGIKKGQKHKSTIERAIIAEQVVTRAKMDGRKLGKEVLDEFMHLFAGMAAHYQPRPTNVTPNINADETKFLNYARLAVETARSLAPYQSPTFRAVVVSTAPTEPTAKVVNNVIDLDDAIGASRVYRRIVAAGSRR